MNNLIKELPGRLSKDYINSLPILRYDGPIILINRPGQAERILNSIKEGALTGFDTETRPTFHRGQSHSVSLVQIAIRRSVYLIQIKQTGIEDSLIRFLENPAILKAGIALRDDLVKLREIRDFDPAGFIDISDMAARKGIIQTGVRALSARYLEGRISKSAQTSNWERRELTEQQKRYAATDAWACLEIYPLLVADQRDYHEAEPDDESTPVDETAASASNED